MLKRPKPPTVGRRSSDFRGIKPGAPICHGDFHFAALQLPHLHFRSVNLGIFDRVEQKLPHGFKHELADLLGFRLGGSIRFELHRESMLLLHLSHEPFQSCRQSLLVEDGRAQIRAQRTGGANSLIDGTCELFRGLQRYPFILGLRTDKTGAEFCANQDLLEVIVQDPRQLAVVLFLLGLHELDGKSLQLSRPFLGRLARRSARARRFKIPSARSSASSRRRASLSSNVPGTSEYMLRTPKALRFWTRGAAPQRTGSPASELRRAKASIPGSRQSPGQNELHPCECKCRTGRVHIGCPPRICVQLGDNPDRIPWRQRAGLFSHRHLRHSPPMPCDSVLSRQ